MPLKKRTKRNRSPRSRLLSSQASPTKKSWLQHTRAKLYECMREAQMLVGLAVRPIKESATMRGVIAVTNYFQRQAEDAARGLWVHARLASSSKGTILLIPVIALAGYSNYQANRDNILHVTGAADATLAPYRKYPSWMHPDPVQTIGCQHKLPQSFCRAGGAFKVHVRFSTRRGIHITGRGTVSRVRMMPRKLSFAATQPMTS
jgi:hypothetical protein